MKIAITGGSGFIGSVLMDRLSKSGHDVFWLDIRPSKAFPDRGSIVDVTDEEKLCKALEGVDIVYHLAAEHRDDVRPIQKYYDVNVGGARSLVNACENNHIKTIIFTSTVAIYGLEAKKSKEDDVPKPFNDYGKSKLESEIVFTQWVEKEKGNTLIMIRPVAIFGVENRGNIYNLIKSIARKRFIMIGNGHNKKSIAYVGNVSAFLEYVLNLKSGKHIYNYADKPDLSTRDLVDKARSSLGFKASTISLPYIFGILGGVIFDCLAKMTGRTFPISAIRVQKFCADTVVSADKIEETNFKRPYSLEEGLAYMIKHEFL